MALDFLQHLQAPLCIQGHRAQNMCLDFKAPSFIEWAARHHFIRNRKIYLSHLASTKASKSAISCS